MLQHMPSGAGQAAHLWDIQCDSACDILVAHLAVGSGHRMAAEALAAAFASQAAHLRVDVRDLLDGSRSWRFRRLPDIYGASLRLVPWAYDWCWRHGKPGRLNDLAEMATCRRAFAQFGALVTAANPQVVICTHGVAARFAARLRRQGARFLHAAALTDFGCHRFWPEQGVDLYITPAPQMTTQLVSRGVPREHIHTCGIPLRPGFWPLAPDREALRSRSGDRRVVVLAGSTDKKLYADAARATQALVEDHARDPSAFTLTVVTGRNEVLRGKLAAMSTAANCRVLGYVADMARLLRQASILVTKPGGSATAEALASGVPLLYIGYAPGQERANLEFAVNNGAAFCADKPEEAPAALRGLLANVGGLRFMAEQARRLGRPRAALDAADVILEAARASGRPRTHLGVRRPQPTQEGVPCSTQ